MLRTGLFYRSQAAKLEYAALNPVKLPVLGLSANNVEEAKTILDKLSGEFNHAAVTNR